MNRTIEIDDEVLAELGRRARPFIDTEPNDVIRALLGLDEAAPSGDRPDEYAIEVNRQMSPARRERVRPTAASRNGRNSRKRAPTGSLLDEGAYWVPILQALEERGGRAAAREVVERVGELVDDQLMPLDRDTLETGGIRWQTRVQFARLRMKEQGLLNPDAPRGVWEITDKGRDRMRQDTTAAAS